MKRIAIIGINGAGKSTLAKELGEKLNLPVYHLDKIYWKPGWVKLPANEGESIQREIVKQEKWIIDGNWAGSLDVRLEPADTIIYLNYPKWLCLYRIIKRAWFTKGSSFDKQEGVNEKLDWFIVKRLFEYSSQNILSKVKQYSEGRKVLIIKSPKELSQLFSNNFNSSNT